MASEETGNGVAMPLAPGRWVDHIVLGVPDTEAGIEAVVELTGVRAEPASTPRPTSYPTRSAGISLGHETFLEIYGPNPGYDGPAHPMHSLLTSLAEPRPLVWFARVASLAAAGEALARAGEELRPMLDEWDRTDAASFRNGHLAAEVFNPSVPYLIEWNDRGDMDTRMASGLSLVELRTVSRDPSRTRHLHRLIGIEVPVDEGSADGFQVRLAGPAGEVVL